MAKFFGKSIIKMDDGDPYLSRWWVGRLRFHVFHRGDQDPDCHDHPWGFWTFPLVSYVEEVIEPRLADSLHGPFNSVQSVVCPPSKAVRYLRVVPRFRFTFNKATHTHRVLGPWNGYSTTQSGYEYPGVQKTKYHNPGVKSGRVVTIVFRQRAFREWGFLKNQGNKWCWQYWRDYITGGKNGPCE
jgi:hypothetical protein